MSAEPGHPGFPDYRQLRVDRPADHVVRLTLDRPPVNALDRELRTALVDAFDRIHDLADDGSVRCVVLAGAGPHFCAGADLREKARLGSRAGERSSARRLTREGFAAVLDCPVPVVAAVDGGALGAGFVLAACCDVILASESAFFAMPEIDVGQGGGASVLQQILPASTMRRMMLTGQRVAAADLHGFGAVQLVKPPVELMAEALRLATTIAAKSPAAVRSIRGAFGPVRALGPREGFDLEQRYTAVLSSSAEGAAARAAFLESRAVDRRQ